MGPLARGCCSYLGAAAAGSSCLITMFQGLLSARGERPNAYPINYWRLTAIIFFIVSGGPLGIEALVAAAGPLVALVCVLGGWVDAAWLH